MKVSDVIVPELTLAALVVVEMVAVVGFETVGVPVVNVVLLVMELL